MFLGSGDNQIVLHLSIKKKKVKKIGKSFVFCTLQSRQLSKKKKKSLKRGNSSLPQICSLKTVTYHILQYVDLIVSQGNMFILQVLLALRKLCISGLTSSLSFQG